MPSSIKRIEDCQLFIFDWDGTLNSMRVTMRLNEAVKRALGRWNKDSDIKEFDASAFDLKRRLNSEEAKNNVETFLFEIFLNFSRPKLHNNSIELLKELKKRKKKIALFTNGRSSRIIREIKYLGIEKYFDSIISARDIDTLKPNPTGLKLILKELNVRPENAVYMGDMVDDIITARLANMKACGIASGFDSYHTLKSTKPDFLFRDIEELSRSIIKNV